ncbi:MAG TPA: hypothetical protein VFA15_05885 [Nitrososphaera sp.]|nr:hypothetical protein [Nitrososphaera sp.]
MNKPILLFAQLALSLCVALNVYAEDSVKISLSDQEAAAVGKRVWQNECGGRIDGLTSWNVGEDFPSLGIGHFIWYPADSHDPFEEKFPTVLAFLQSHGVKLPDWLTPQTHCPWRNRQEFLDDINGTRLQELRQLLAATVSLQTQFLIKRLEDALPRILSKSDSSQRAILSKRFYRVLDSGAKGKFALIDYVNFKGEGVNDSERYKGEGWGLLQVLQGMSDEGDPLISFARSAEKALTRRVANSPPERHEIRWLPGWKKRIERYYSTQM